MIDNVDENGHITSTNSIEFYPKQDVKKCSICSCFFFNSHDYHLHVKDGCAYINTLPWKKSKEKPNPNSYGYNSSQDRQYISIDENRTTQKLAKRLENQTNILIGHYQYFLSQNKRWLQREPLQGYIPKKEKEETETMLEYE